MIEPKKEIEIREWLDKNFPVDNLDLSEEEVEKRFIENFGQDTYDEFLFTNKLDNVDLKLTEFLGIPYIPFFFQEMDEDGRYYPDLDAFSINKKYCFDWIESLKSLIHEVKHSHQRYCVAHKNKKNLKFAPKNLIVQWEKELSIDPKTIPSERSMELAIEIDAFAFTKYILDIWFGHEYHHHDDLTDSIFKVYADKYFYGIE